MAALLLIVAIASTAVSTPAPCQVPRNCGQHNNTVVCGHKFTGCEFVCGKESDPRNVGCCHPKIILTDEICNGCVKQLCNPPPPLPPPIPACNATNFHEFWCTVTNVSESFQALATRLHVNPTKLCEYNFLYDCSAGVTPNNSIRVPYDQCTPKQGVWDCYEVKAANETLVSVATGPSSVVADPELLKNMNLDILYGGDYTLHPGQQLRIPTWLHCFEDLFHECYTVISATETLQSVAKTYDMTAESLCKANSQGFGRNYCDPAFEPLPKLLKGMELAVARLHFTPPSPCKEIPGYWTCYTVKVNDTSFDVASQLEVTYEDFVTTNFGENPMNCGNCSNVTECPQSLTDMKRGPLCLRIGQVVSARINSKCTPEPGAWGCFNSSSALGGGICGWVDAITAAGSPSCMRIYPDSAGYNSTYFCQANRNYIDKYDVGIDCPKTMGIGASGGWPKAPSDYHPHVYNLELKAPHVKCIPNDKSYCRNDPSTAGNWGNSAVGCTMLPSWDGNELPCSGLGGEVGDCVGEIHIPRGSLPPSGQGGQTGCDDPSMQLVQCTPEPGKHICHKPIFPVLNASGYPIWTDTVDQIARRFGVDAKALCALNELKNCSSFCWFSAFKIPVA
jgi:hypothetical protein